ncbi:protein fantom-like [Ostrinia furnacalis]|uniref:protein fantom-like n=1 Tax=Ostrinia furnacalis TaxID=93504 RepID=UPI00103ED74D|nr:protein fantom-like [Ostrinia furnacalis]
MAKCRSTNRTEHSSKDCVIFSVISEPPEDPLGLDNCEDIGYAYLYLGDLLAYSSGNDSYIEVVPVQGALPGEAVCGVLAVKVDGLDVLRRCALMAVSQTRDLSAMY